MTARLGLLRAAALAFLLAGLAAHAPVACAADTPADSTVEGYVRSMADSTDRWFGLSALPADTTGIDSVRAWVLAHPGRSVRRRGPGFALMPLAGFNRAVGGALGGEVSLGSRRGMGRLTANAQWTTGADLWLGGGRYTKSWRATDQEGSGLQLDLRAGRECNGLDRDYHQPVLSAVSALVFGSDRSHYLRRDGARARLAYGGSAGWLGAGGRAEIESLLATTATWTLFGRDPVVVENDSARFARVHEVDALAGVRLGFVPLTLEGHVWSGGGVLGGDVDYTRLRLAAGGALGLGRHVAFAPEFEYGRLTGAALPQEAFYLGGGTLRSLAALSLQGTGRALVHADFILNDAVQTMLGFDPEPAFPVQLGAFVGAGAVWGSDPVTGRAALTRRDWPDRRDWLAETGVSLMYRPGLPRPDSFVRIDYAIPIGADARESSLYVSYTQALNFLHR